MNWEVVGAGAEIFVQKTGEGETAIASTFETDAAVDNYC